jgi:gliding motility-associated-like protein
LGYGYSAYITVDLVSDKAFNTIFPNEVITFTAVPDSFDNYEFFWNDASVQNGTSNTWSSSKINHLDSVWVIANYLGCTSARSLDTIRVVDFPNAFTPNNDGVNDVFLDGYQLIITNRWGQTLYEGRDGWDGRYKGDKVSPGTYYYIVTLDNITDRKNAIKGTVLLIED